MPCNLDCQFSKNGVPQSKLSKQGYSGISTTRVSSTRRKIISEYSLNSPTSDV